MINGGSNMKKVCFVASTGGHFEQLMMLKKLMKKYNSFIITEKTDYDCTKENIKTYYLLQINRHEKNWIIKMIINMINSFKIFLKEKPDVVISTGALSSLPICIFAKIFRRKLVFIESFAKITSPTMTGRLVYKFADQFYVQWEGMKEYYPKAIWKGGLY